MFVSLSEAAKILRSGHVVGMPTETVYGLAGRIDSESAVREIFTVKDRPFFDPLIVHVSSVAQAKTLVKEWPSVAEILAKHFWPGPLTLVLPKSEKVSGLITSGLSSVGIRCPRHPLAQQLIELVGVPLAAPSANKFGHTSPTQAQHVLQELNVPVLDGGASDVGIESTVLLIRIENKIQLSILREGHILQSEIENFLRSKNEVHEWSKEVSRRESPGHLKHHYMPSVPLILCKRKPRNEEHLRQVLAELIRRIPDSVEGIQIKKPKKLDTLKEFQLSSQVAIAARELYQKLREYSESNPDLMYYIAPADFNSEAWSAIKDRMEKAASLVLDEELA